MRRYVVLSLRFVQDKSRYVALLLLALIVAGCSNAGTAPGKPLPIDEKKVWASQEQKPDWTIKEPGIKDGIQFFIGLSDKFATEKEARDNAYSHALNNTVKYISTDIRTKTERLIASTGLSSKIIDPTVTARGLEEQLSSAVARRVKPQEWYIEKWERKQGSEKRTYYMIYLLAQVPQEEVERVIAEQISRQDEMLKAVKASQEQLARAKSIILEADNQSGQPVQSWSRYQDAIKQAGDAMALIAGYPELKEMTKEIDILIESTEKKIKAVMDNPETMLAARVMALAKDAAYPVTVAIAKASYQDTDLSSEFGGYLIQRIETIMGQEKALYNVIAQKVFRDELKRHQSPIEDCLSGKFTALTSTVLAQVNGLVFVRYWEKGYKVDIKMELLEVGKGTILGSTSVELPKSMFPNDIAYKPGNDLIAGEGLKALGSGASSGHFKVKVWADKGEGSVYKEGEHVQFHFRSGKDCYIYLYHMDAAGSVKLLFPNSFNRDNRVKANQVYSIPDDTMNFDFQITEPLGAEMVKAFASLQPIKDMEIKPDETGFRDIGKIMDAKTRDIITRSIEAVAKEGFAENTCVITTVRESR
ncbi:MAG: DUF4384 domain-containing protein [Planctomycetota bacterium]